MPAAQHGLPGPGLTRAASWAGLLAGLVLTGLAFLGRNDPAPATDALGLDLWLHAVIVLLAASLAFAASARLPQHPKHGKALAGWAAFVLAALLVVTLFGSGAAATLVLVAPAASLAGLAVVGADWPPANP